MPVKLIAKPQISDCRLTLMTTGKKSSSFRVIIPSEIVKEMGLANEERFIIDYDSLKPDVLMLKRTKPDELRALLE